MTVSETGMGLASDSGLSGERSMMRVRFYAEAVQLVEPSAAVGQRTEDFTAALSALAKSGVARGFTPEGSSIEDLAELATRAWSSIEDSPNPAAEWNIASILGDQLASLVGISVSSMHRYRSGERRTPDDVAARLHVIALIVADLAGSYNDYGIRRWFERARTALGGLTPSEVLSGDGDPSSTETQTVRGLAYALTT